MGVVEMKIVDQAQLIDVDVRGDARAAAAREAVGECCAESLAWLADLLGRESRRKNAPLARRERRQMAEALRADPSPAALGNSLLVLFRRLGFEGAIWLRAPDVTDLPMVAIIPAQGYRYVRARGADGVWIVEGAQGAERIEVWPDNTMFTAAHARPVLEEARTARALFLRIFREEPGWIVHASLASVVASALMLATSLYSLQVYDRVIGSGAISTLIVLTVGVCIAILIELVVKAARASIVDRAAAEIDHKCSHGVFARLLSVRLDQRPGAVGTLAAQVRGYETIRAFATSLVLFLATDGPFAFFFLFVIYLIGGPVVAGVPLVFLIVTASVGFYFKRRIEKYAQGQAMAGNLRQGLLVEAIEGAESVKATGTGWRLLGRWNTLSRQSMDEGLEIKRMNDMSTYLAAMLQQISYVGLVGAGAWIAATSTDITMGGLIACSILSGRVLTPINAIPGLLVQWAHTKVALANLEKLFDLESDNYGVASPLSPEGLSGRIEVADVKFVYPGQVTAVSLPRLVIEAGEKVAILGPVGAGKSSLLRLLGGLTRAQRGQVLIDGLDVQQIAAERRAELIGYLPQQVSLFAGTLRENLLAGVPALAEAELLAGCEATGLKAVIAGRAEGLDLPIMEGGGGLSGGQKQLVGVTRLLLAQPSLWLLDEPTAAMDEGTEARCLHALKRTIRPEHTMVLVTHKAQLLGLVQRVIVLTPQGIVMDGPRDEVLARLRAQQPGAGAAPIRPVVVHPAGAVA